MDIERNVNSWYATLYMALVPGSAWLSGESALAFHLIDG